METKEFDYIFNKYLKNIKVIGNEKQLDDKKTKVTDVLIDNINYLNYKECNESTIFIPQGLTFKGDFLPIYMISKTEQNFRFIVFSKTNGLFESKIYSYAKLNSVIKQNVRLEYLSFQDTENNILKQYEKEKVSIYSFILNIFSNKNKLIKNIENFHKYVLLNNPIDNKINFSELVEISKKCNLNFKNINIDDQLTYDSLFELYDNIMENPKEKTMTRKK